MERLLTPIEVSNILKLSLASVYSLSSQGKLPKIKLGAALRFKESDILDHIERCRIEARGPICI
ncbi:MAG: helix-turn-helix domain-containing protein [bacterium]|nr:helix-turn-helix domain-containing protein [bacterium]